VNFILVLQNCTQYMYVEYSDWMILITKSKFALDCCFTAKPDPSTNNSKYVKDHLWPFLQTLVKLSKWLKRQDYRRGQI
jgi:hypothetical protein